YNLFPKSGEILLANNTVFECSAAFTFTNTVAYKGMHLRNNLVLAATQPDILMCKWSGTPGVFGGIGDGTLVPKLWQMDHNWREVKEPTAAALMAKAWVPPGADDVRADKIVDLSRDPASPNFLRPAGSSLLATGGAGKTDPSLPSYVGAVPPEGALPW